MQYSLFILAQGFCLLKIKINQFPGRFCLKLNVVWEEGYLSKHHKKFLKISLH